MTDSDRSDDPTLPMAEKRVFCKRIGRDLPVVEHHDCPYCFGSQDAIATGEHGEFCDFRRGVDPVSFGLRDDDARHLRG